MAAVGEREREGRKVTKPELAEILGITTQAVDQMMRRGCPMVRHGGRGHGGTLFDTAAVIAWREERAATMAKGPVVDLEEAKVRKAVADAEDAELKVAERRGELVSIDDVADLVEREYASVRSRLESIPDKVAPRWGQAKSVSEARLLLRGEIREAENELSSGDTVARLAAERGRARKTGVAAAPGAGEEPPAAARVEDQRLGRRPAHPESRRT